MPSKKTTPFDVRVMTFNIRYDNPRDGENSWENRKEFACDIVRDYAPDVLGLQEANRHQLDVFRASLPEYAEVGIGRDGGRQGEYAPILYRSNRFDLVASGTFWLSETPTKPSRDWDSSCRRICTWAQLTDNTSKRSFYVYNTHLDHKSQMAREKGIQLIMAHAGQRKPRDPFIITGDLNAGEDNPVIAFLKSAGKPESKRDLLVDSFRVAHPDETIVGTGHGFKGNVDGRKADYIFVTPDTHTLEAAIVTTSRDGRYPSDHFPVTATLRFEQKEQPRRELR